MESGIYREPDFISGTLINYTVLYFTISSIDIISIIFKAHEVIENEVQYSLKVHDSILLQKEHG